METLVEENKEVKQEQPSAILYGKKTIAFPFTAADLDHFAQLHREDKSGYMGRYSLKNMTQAQAKEYVLALIFNGEINIWTIYTKQGKSSTVVGYAYLTDVSSFSAGVGGIMDRQFARGLTKQMRKDKYTYAEDAFRSIINFAFSTIGLLRLTSEIVETNRTSMALTQRTGFKREGVQRNAFKIDDKFYNLHMFGLLREEYSNG